MKIQKTYIGVDVAKRGLQVHLNGRQIELDNNAEGHTRLCAELRIFESPHVICEATGGYERLMVEALQNENKTVSVVNPALVRNAARALGKRAKTDKIDAEMLTDFGVRYEPKPTLPVSKNQRRLTDLAVWLRQLVAAKAHAKTQIEHHADEFVREQSAMLITHYEQQIKKTEEEMRKLVKEDFVFLERLNCLMEIKGVGERTAFMVLVFMPEIGSLSRREVASLAGLAPWVRDSGAMKGKRSICGGRAEVRRAIYMSAFTAAHCHPALKPFYERLKANGKHHKVAMTAVMRKLIIFMNIRLKELAQKTAETQKACNN